jgi:hypothetical protein
VGNAIMTTRRQAFSSNIKIEASQGAHRTPLSTMAGRASMGTGEDIGKLGSTGPYALVPVPH